MFEKILSKTRELNDETKEPVATQAGSCYFGDGSLSE